MRAVEEWHGTHDDQAIPPRVQLRIYERYNGQCPKCSRKLYPRKWACDHIVALINGGAHRESNLQPLCVSPCHSDKTRADMQIKSKGYKRRLRKAGIRKPRTIRAWRKFNGERVYASRER